MSVNIVNVAAAIHGLSITGLTIRDLDEIKELMPISDLPCLVPHPRDFVTAIGAAPVAHKSNAKTDVTYSLRYRLYFKPVTGQVKFFGPYKTLVQMVELIINKVIDNDAFGGAIDIRPKILAIGGVEDHAGNVYHGADLQFDVLEYYEV